MGPKGLHLKESSLYREKFDDGQTATKFTTNTKDKWTSQGDVPLSGGIFWLPVAGGGGDLLYHEWFFYSIRFRPKVKVTLRRGLGVFIITQEDWKSLTIARWKSKGSFSSVISRPWVVIQPTTTSFIWQQGIEPGPKSAPSKSHPFELYTRW